MEPKIQEQLESVESHYFTESVNYSSQVFGLTPTEGEAEGKETSDNNTFLLSLLRTDIEGPTKLQDIKTLEEFDLPTNISSLTYEELTELGPSYFENKKQEISTFSAKTAEQNKPTIVPQAAPRIEKYTGASEAFSGITTESVIGSVTSSPVGDFLQGLVDRKKETTPTPQGDVISFPGEEPIRLPAGSLNLSTLGGIAGNMNNQSNLTAGSKNMLTVALENLLKENDLVIEGTSVGQVS